METLDKTKYIAAASYVDSAIATRQETLDSGNGGNVSTSGTGPMVTGVSASGGSVTVSMSEVTIPVGEPNTTTPNGRAPIWIE